MSVIEWDLKRALIALLEAMTYYFEAKTREVEMFMEGDK